MADPKAASTHSTTDSAPVIGSRMPDRGPRYQETPRDPYSPNAPIIAEPWNAATAAIFIVIVVFWAWRLRGRYRDYPFLCCCMPILLAGGIGGTLYHATRSSVAFFLLDLVPIQILALAGALFMAIRLWGRSGWWFIPGVAVFNLAVYFLMFQIIGPIPSYPHLPVNISYTALAIVVLVPVGLVLIRTRFRYAGWVVAAVISFAMALFFRLVDSEVGRYLPMGSHWLWHLFGAITTALMIEYFYRVEGEKPPSDAPVSSLVDGAGKKTLD